MIELYLIINRWKVYSYKYLAMILKQLTDKTTRLIVNLREPRESSEKVVCDPGTNLPRKQLSSFYVISSDAANFSLVFQEFLKAAFD